MPKSCYLNFKSCDRYINVNYFSFFTIITNIGRQEKKMKKLKFSMKSLTCSCLICALNLYFAPKVLRKAKFARGCHDCQNRKKLLQTLKVAQKLTTTIGKGLNNRSLLENLMSNLKTATACCLKSLYRVEEIYCLSMFVHPFSSVFINLCMLAYICL